MSLSELQNEYRQAKASLEKIEKEINALHNKRRIVQEKCEELEVKIEVCQATEENFRCSDSKWAVEEFPWKKNLVEKFNIVFKMKNFREKQLEVMNATLSGNDVFLVMPTGGGKSLCYQLPALISDGITLVISPLISLMEDQCHHMKQLGIEAAYLCADTPKETASAAVKELSSATPEFKLLYVTPEKIAKSKRFMSQLEKCYKKGKLSRIAIDEAHCASQWGNDFRPDYKILGILKRQYPNTPILALTATATSKVIVDTKKILNIPQALIFKTGLNRSNLFYQVRFKPKAHDEVMDDMVNIIKQNFSGQSGIVYCFSRSDSMKVAESLCNRGIQSASYHAYMPSDIKSNAHRLWREGHIQVICATVAFGMGIDKPDVRFVIHHSLSKSLENYYQESGRAGRDGEPALCLLYFGFQDMFRQSTMVLTEHTGLENLAMMVGYCYNLKRCRREQLASHFGELHANIQCHRSCDTCYGMNDIVTRDVTQPCRLLVEVVKKAEAKGEGHRLTAFKLLEAAAGRGSEKCSDKVILELDRIDLQRIITYMLMHGYLREDFHFNPYLTISYLVPGLASIPNDITVHVDFFSSRQSTPSYKDIFSQMMTRDSLAFTSFNKRKESDVSNASSSKRRRKLKDTIVIGDSD